MSKKEKKAVNPAEEVALIKTEETIIDTMPKETKTVVKKAKTETSANKKSPKAPKETKAAKKAPNPVTKPEILEQVYFQYAETELSTQAILEQVKQLWVATGQELSAIQTLNLYIKPEENVAYYVINDVETGKVNL